MRTPGDALAVECTACHTVQPSTRRNCACGGRLVSSPIPYILTGKFRFKRRLGAGGMGIVYLAEDMTLGREVAVKTLPQMSSSYALRLRREARAVASLAHPNLATIFGAETWQGTPMLVFEYLKGGTLAEKLQQSPLSPDAVVDIGIVLADTLRCIHAAGVLHCDIKPSNIGFTADGTAKLLDFGLARILLDSQEQRALDDRALESPPGKPKGCPSDDRWSVRDSTLRIVGTPLYLSPEALSQRVVDATGDLWGATMTLYEAVAAHHPLEGMPARNALPRIARAEFPDVRTFIRDCPDALAEFLRAGLARDPRLRPKNARELKARLVAVRASLDEAPRSA